MSLGVGSRVSEPSPVSSVSARGAGCRALGYFSSTVSARVQACIPATKTTDSETASQLQSKASLYRTALVVMFLHSNRALTKTPINSLVHEAQLGWNHFFSA